MNTMSEAEILSDAAIIAGTTATEIPDKLYFRIGEVARLAAIKPYVLRFWESEFPSLDPKKSGTGHRLYRRKDVEQVLEIKQLLYERRFTIEGARKFLEGKAKGRTAQAAPGEPPARTRRGKTAKAKAVQSGLFENPGPALDAVRKELEDILSLLK
jgi:DNA-binding transcriptional MerR regulator